MSFKLPGSKGAATITARMLEANASDLEQAAAGFREAAKLYRAGYGEQAQGYADGSFGLAKTALHAWATRH